MQYVDYFLNLKCASDVLEIVSPINAGPAKEISEAVTIVKRLRKETLKNPMKYNILELCAGNPLPSMITVFTQPVDYVVAVDKRKVLRKWERVNRFRYETMNIYTDDVFKLINENTIIISSHPCKELAKRIVQLYLNSPARSLYLIPCCVGKHIPGDFPQKDFIKSNMGNYKAWGMHLAFMCNGKIEQDNKCLSPKNLIITAKK